MADISIVTPYCQGAGYIAECVHSVRRQSVASWEHSVVDDGSPDNPAPILSSFQVEDSRFTWNRVNPSCAVLRRSVFEAAGRWDETLAQTGEDRDLWMRMNLRAPAHFVALPLVRRRWHSTSVLRMVNASEQREREAMMLRKWRRGDHLRSQDRSVVESAFTFLDRRFVPWMYLRWGNEAAAHGQFAHAARHYVRAGVRRLGISAKPWMRRERPGRLPGRSPRDRTGTSPTVSCPPGCRRI